MANGNPTALIMSSQNILADELAKNLKSKNCTVNIIDSIDKLPESADYIFLLEGLTAKGKPLTFQDLKKIFEFIRLTNPKGALVVPFIAPAVFTESIDAAQKEFFASEEGGMSLIFAGELYGVGMDLNMPGMVAQTFGGLTQGRVKVPQVDFTVFPAYAPAVAEKIIRGVFSYGFEKDRVVVADKVSAFAFIRKVKEFAGNAIFERDAAFRKPATQAVFRFDEVKAVTDESIKETISWVISHFVPQGGTSQDKKNPKISVKKPRIAVKKPAIKIQRKKILVAFVAALWVISFPFLTVLGALATGKAAENTIRQGNLGSGESFANASLFLSTLSRRQFQFLNRLPLAGPVFKFPYEISKALESGGQLGKEGIESARNLKSIAEGVLTDKDFDLKAQSSKLYLGLDEIYNKLSFLEAELKGVRPIEVKSLKNYVLASRDLVGQMPVLLGQQKPSSYLILFQDEKELRPTGGFIGAFALVTFDAGKLIDAVVYDIRSTDAQLKGHVEPPTQIKNYLGVESWLMRDSNWDPDFSASAAKSEWFLEKEIDRHVDGVIAVDYVGLKEITGVSIEKNNLVGSLRSAMDRLRDPEVLFKTFNIIPKLVSERRVQVFLHDVKARGALGLISATGEVVYEPCSGNCADIWTGLVEANLGRNGVNSNVTRQVSLDSAVRGQFIENKMTVILKNTSSKEAYKTYIRALAPVESIFEKTAARGPDGVKSLTTEVNEVRGQVEGGVLVDVAPVSSKTITFSWKSPTKANLGKPGKAYVFFRKQAGVSAYPVSVNLTHKSKLLYNTTLTRDFETESAWK